MWCVSQRDVGAHGMASGAGDVMRYAVLASVFSLACAWATVARLRSTLLDRARPAGVMTQGALMAFENEHGLATDGVAGPTVWKSLLTAAVNGKPSTFGCG